MSQKVMKKICDFSLILPCYNEMLILEKSITTILTVLSLSRLSYEIIFVDDHSTDGTLDVLNKICHKYSDFHVISHSKNYGRGRSVADGIRHASGTIVGYIDIDLEVSPVYLPMMVQTICDGSADVVIGRRIYRSRFTSLFREIASAGYRWLSDRLLDTGGLDTETGYKFFNRRKILPLLSVATHPHWFWDTEIMVFAKRAGLHIMELPVLFLRRKDKHSSVKIFPDISDYFISLWRLKRRLK